ncbi:PP2C family protein-serine/threonine phosphatase [Nocardioides bruguierae]|uniref:Serine/threonine-protein phosphatase n=1 Tax=Nocardioides bruguierae TaxID=2945102 RepID=A0A9X2D3Z3_9ACTN|nr:PP2C family protein-serine/threonine phosphatase [Nocardioides bruguierae]MCL8025827.1 serine/threonine-protein phosphatase [Nocardioides bruguierae]MCM0618942.1 serine/threonine-protein phosphatase [Nocardioides bruguierae]
MPDRSPRPASALRALLHAGDDLAGQWRSGTTRSQGTVLGVLLVGVAVCVAISLWRYAVMPVSTYYVWLVLGMLLLRFRALLLLTAVTLPAAYVVGLVDWISGGEFGSARASGMIALALGSALVLWQSSRQRSGLPAPLSESMLADLRDRLAKQGNVPPLPDGWRVQTATKAAHSVGYAGDFMVARLDEDQHHLEMILVDVVGKGVAAGTDALQFAGALGGLLGSLPPVALMEAANDFLLRQDSDEAMATAVHVLVDLRSGRFQVHSAGHPPALSWVGTRGTWAADEARGLALGVMHRAPFESSCGVLEPGDALLFYTDGVVEEPGGDIEDGVEWLRETARLAVRPGFDGAARRILRSVPRGDDDRAVLLLERYAPVQLPPELRVGLAVPPRRSTAQPPA